MTDVKKVRNQWLSCRWIRRTSKLVGKRRKWSWWRIDSPRLDRFALFRFSFRFFFFSQNAHEIDPISNDVICSNESSLSRTKRKKEDIYLVSSFFFVVSSKITTILIRDQTEDGRHPLKTHALFKHTWINREKTHAQHCIHIERAERYIGTHRAGHFVNDVEKECEYRWNLSNFVRWTLLERDDQK